MLDVSVRTTWKSVEERLGGQCPGAVVSVDTFRMKNDRCAETNLSKIAHLRESGLATLFLLSLALVGSPRTSGPSYARRGFTAWILIDGLSILGSDTEFTRRLFIKLACDWQILSLLIRAKAGSGP